LINNRQTGRRRGRGGGGPRSPNQPSPGNRQENRSRGNAAQLLEKYKSLARDAQLQGDRVQSEYYLQFAEHYFRVLNENRARFEEQRRQRGDYYSEEDEEQDEGVASAESDEEQGGRDEREERFERQPRGDRGDGGERRREYRDARNGERRPDRQRPRGEDWSPRDDRQEPEAEERISLDVLPPALSSEGDAPAKAPRARRPRRPRAEGEAGEVDLPPAA
jgi:hypothetical protein